jgi:hypothetical protein
MEPSTGSTRPSYFSRHRLYQKCPDRGRLVNRYLTISSVWRIPLCQSIDYCTGI